MSRYDPFVMAPRQIGGEVCTQIPALVDCIELELRRIGLWEADRPPQCAFDSDLPFMLDTMRVSQWLQWVFLPRMRRILYDRKPLPTACAIHPIAKMDLAGTSSDTGRLLKFIARLDGLLSARGAELH
ncbi:MAG: YqcC family protein [Gammaproteobacteria bacterium]